MFNSLFKQGIVRRTALASSNWTNKSLQRDCITPRGRLVPCPSAIHLLNSAVARQWYATKVNKDGTPTTSTSSNNATLSKPLKNRPSKKKSSSTSSSNSGDTSSSIQAQQEQQQFQYLSIQTKKEQQAENLQQLMRMLIMIEERERVHNQLGGAGGDALGEDGSNTAPITQQQQQQQQGHQESIDLDASMNYMITYQFFRNIVAFKNWWVSTTISHQHTPGKEFSGLNIILRAFTDQKQFNEYKNSLSLKGKSGKDERAMKVENMAQYIECVLLNEQVSAEKDENRKKELQEQLAKSPYASMVAFVPSGVTKMIIDDGSNHAFTLEKQYFKPIVKWRSIQEIESAIHCIRLWALSKTARNNYDNSVYLEEEVDEDPIQALLDYDRFFTIRKPNGAWVLIPESSATATTSSEQEANVVTELADDNGIDHSQVKTISGSNLFRVLNQAYDKIEGIVINAGNLHPHTINQEVTFTKEFVRAVAEADNEEEE